MGKNGVGRRVSRSAPYRDSVSLWRAAAASDGHNCAVLGDACKGGTGKPPLITSARLSTCPPCPLQGARQSKTLRRGPVSSARLSKSERSQRYWRRPTTSVHDSRPHDDRGTRRDTSRASTVISRSEEAGASGCCSDEAESPNSLRVVTQRLPQLSEFIASVNSEISNQLAQFSSNPVMDPDNASDPLSGDVVWLQRLWSERRAAAAQVDSTPLCRLMQRLLGRPRAVEQAASDSSPVPLHLAGDRLNIGDIVDAVDGGVGEEFSDGVLATTSCNTSSQHTTRSRPVSSTSHCHDDFVLQLCSSSQESSQHALHILDLCDPSDDRHDRDVLLDGASAGPPPAFWCHSHSHGRDLLDSLQLQSAMSQDQVGHRSFSSVDNNSIRALFSPFYQHADFMSAVGL